jgi:hypothetical protein
MGQVTGYMLLAALRVLAYNLTGGPHLVTVCLYAIKPVLGQEMRRYELWQTGLQTVLISSAVWDREVLLPEMELKLQPVHLEQPAAQVLAY